MMPVTAGKKIANSGIIETTPSAGARFPRRFSNEKLPIGPSRKTRIETPSTAMMKYCALIAQSAPFQTRKARIPPRPRFRSGKYGRSCGHWVTRDSDAPRMLNGIASDCDTNSVSPIDVPKHGPSTRLIR